MDIEIFLCVLLSISLVVIGYAFWQIARVTREAFAYIKSNSIEEKIQSDSLDRTLKQVEKIAPPELKKPPTDPKSSEFTQHVVRNGVLKDARGHEWELI